MKFFQESRNVFLVVLAMVFVLSACGNTGSGGSQSNKDGKVTVNILQSKVEFKEQFESAAEKFMKENPDINIEVETIGGGNDYSQVLKSKIASKSEPDIFNINGKEDLDYHKDRLLELTTMDSVKKVLDKNLLSPVSLDDKTFGVPMNQEGYGIIYNKEIFEKANIDVESIKSLDDLKKVAKKIDSQKEDLNIEAAFALPGKEKWVLSDHAASVFLTDDFDNTIEKAVQSKSLPFSKSDQLKKYLDIQKDFSKQPVGSIDYSQQVEELFSTGKVAMIQQGNWAYPTIESVNPELAENIGIFPIPVDNEMKMPVGVSAYWAVNSKSDEKVQEASKKFIDWLYTEDEGKKVILNEFKFIPVHKDYDTEKIADPLSKEIYKYAEEGETSQWIFKGYPTGYTNDSLGSYLQNYVIGESTFDDAISKAKKAWESARK